MTKRYSKRPSSKRRSKRNVAATANKALAIAKKTQRRVELKYHDILEATTTVPDIGTTPVPLTNPGQGDNPNNRDGTSIFVTSVDIRGSLISDPNVVTRLIVYSWISGTSANISDILAGTGISTSVYEHKNWDKRFRSNILLDKIICPRGYSGIGTIENPFHYRIKGLNHRVTMTTGSTAAETNMIYFALISDVDATGSPPTVQWRSRAIFKDL